VADKNTAIPNGTGNFTDFGGPVLSGGNVAFVGLGSSGQTGIYLATSSAGACPNTFDFTFSGTQYADCFRELLRGDQIAAGPDVSGTGHDSLAFTGIAGSGSATWLTVYDATPTTAAPGPTFGAETLCADVIFARFNNIKGAGVVALFREGVGQQGIALVVSDAGNTDLLRLVTVDGDPAKQGKVNALATVPLHNGIAENEWYRLIMTVDPVTPLVTGQVFAHVDPRDAASSLGAQVGTTLSYSLALPASVTGPGENGILAQAISAAVDLSVTNFSNDATRCAQ